MYWYTAADALISTQSEIIADPVSGWQKASMVVVVPATAAYGNFAFRAVAMTAGLMYCDDAYVCKQRSSSDIEEGAVTAASNILADESVIQAKMKLLSVGTPQLALLAVAEGNIAALAVTSAKIGLLAVNTLHVAGNAITLPVSAYTAGTQALSSTLVTVQSLVMACTGDPVEIIFSCSAYNLDGGEANATIYQIRIIRTVAGTPTTIHDTTPTNGLSVDYNEAIQVSFTFKDSPGTYEATYAVQMRLTSSGSITTMYRSMFAISVKK